MSLAGATLAGMSAPLLPETHRFAGIITTAELAAARMSDAKIRTLVRRGVLTPVCREAYAHAELAARARAAGPRTERMLTIAAAIAVASEHVVASHFDAAIGRRRQRTTSWPVPSASGQDAMSPALTPGEPLAWAARR